MVRIGSVPADLRIRAARVALGAVMPLLLAACGSNGRAAEGPAAEAPAIAVTTAEATSRPIARVLRVTGSLAADEQAEVSAEIAGRVVSTPVERGSRVAQGTPLVTLSNVESRAQLAEAEANAAQIEARLGVTAGEPFDLDRVPDVAAAKASLTLAEAEYARIETLLDQRVVSRSEFDQRRTQVEAARQQHESARNAARQQWQSLQAAHARVDLARKAMDDTIVRAPFSGLVAERSVSVGDYVNRGTVVVTLVRIHPLRLELTVPEQAIAHVRTGANVSLTVDAYPGKTFTGTVRFVSPSVQTDQRALTVEAIVPNEDGALKPGLFATAEMTQAASAPAVLVPADAVRVVSGTARVFVVKGDRVEERIVATGQTVGALVEIVNGVMTGDVLATSNVSQLSDGSQVSLAASPATAPSASSPR
jgi:multidrug efflux pump subunit AcrA (membrane-fusion protein)